MDNGRGIADERPEVVNAAAHDAAGNLYEANFNLSTVTRFSPTGVNLGDFATTGLNAPFGLAFDAAGNLYVRTRP